jgi:hypothetical protein
MKKMNKPLFLITILGLLFLYGCSFFIAKIDTPLVSDSYKKKPSQIATFCKQDKPLTYQLIGTNSETQSAFLKAIQKTGRTFDIIDHFVLWSLVQLHSRPDQSAPTARLQVLLNVEGKTGYFDFFSESQDDQYPYFYGLEWILKKYGKKITLEAYATLLEKTLPRKLVLGKEFSGILAVQKEAIKKDPILAAHYIRGSEILKEGETLPHLNLLEVIRHYRRNYSTQQIIVNTSLTSYTVGKDKLAECNYDFNLYDNSIFLIDKVIPSSNLFGLTFSKSAFLAASSQKVLPVGSLLGTSLFKGDSKVRSSAVCVIENQEKKIWAFSNQSRDPGQHLFHLIRYGLPKSNSIPEVDKLLKHSRHLFLSEPVRLIIESNRSKSDQIENLLKLNLPIYNAENLGNIWAYTFFQDQSNFLIDDRNTGYLSCK